MDYSIKISNPPTLCGLVGCANDAYVTIYVADGGWTGLCPACLDELQQLQSGVTLPEQRARVITMDVTRKGRAESPRIDESEGQ